MYLKLVYLSLLFAGNALHCITLLNVATLKSFGCCSTRRRMLKQKETGTFRLHHYHHHIIRSLLVFVIQCIVIIWHFLFCFYYHQCFVLKVSSRIFIRVSSVKWLHCITALKDSSMLRMATLKYAGCCLSRRRMSIQRAQCETKKKHIPWFLLS